MKKKYLWKVIDLSVLAVVVALLFLYLFRVLGFSDNTHSKAVFQQLYDLPENIVDVAWLGPSSVQEYIIPSQIYEETGITVYPLALGSVPFDSTELLIKEMEKTQDPKVYLIDIRDLAFSSLSDPSIRRVTDNMAMSENRTAMIDQLTSDWQEFLPVNKFNKLDYYFSFPKYHARWQELEKADFVDDDEVFLGYWIGKEVRVYDKTEVLSRMDAKEVDLPAENVVFLNRFLDFCDSFDKRVVFTHTPHCLDEEKFGQYNLIMRLIRERGYEVWDMNESVDEIGLDYQTDFQGPLHTNVWGSKKVTSYVSRCLVNYFHLPNHRGDPNYADYEEYVTRFNRALDEYELTQITDFETYLEKLVSMKEGCNIYIATYGIQGYGLSNQHASTLKQLGLDQVDELTKPEYRSYAAIISDGNVLHEQLGEGTSDTVIDTYVDNTKVSLSSANWKGFYGCSIRLGMTERSQKENGFNIVVTDKETGEIIDTVAFDTKDEACTCIRFVTFEN